MRTSIPFWIFLIILPVRVALALEPGEPSMALVALDDRAGVWRDLLLEKLIVGEAVVLDRSSAAELLKEREILLSDTRPGETRSLLRKWVSADMLISLEAFSVEKGEPERARVRVLDGKTGIRLLDRTHGVSANKLEADLGGVAAWIEGPGTDAWRALWLEDSVLNAVAVLDVNLTSLNRERLEQVDTLVLQLEQRLIRDPGVVLLEREVLESMLAEQDLNPALQRKLAGAVCLLQLSFEPGAGGIRFVVRGVSSDGRELFRDERGDAFGEGRVSSMELVDLTMRATHGYFDLPGEPSRSDFAEEARRFLEASRYYVGMNRFDMAVPYAKTAFLMRPDSSEIHTHYKNVLYYQADREIRHFRPGRDGSDAPIRLLSDLRRVVDLTAPLPRQRVYLSNLIRDFLKKLRNKMSRHPELEEEWAEIHRRYRRTFEFGVKNERRGLEAHSADTITAEERNAYFELNLLTRTPLSGSDFFWLVGKWTHYGDMPFGPLPEPLARSLISMVREDPWMPGVEKHKWLSILQFALKDRNPEGEKLFREHLHQILLHSVLEPGVLTTIPNVGSFDPEYMDLARSMRKEFRDRIEHEGWFLPELYKDDKSKRGYERFMRNLRDPSMRLVPRKYDPPFTGGMEDEILKRMVGWGAGSIWVKLRDDLYEETPESHTYTTLHKGDRPFLATCVFGEILVIRAGGRLHKDQELRFYRMDPSGNVHLVETLPLPGPDSGELPTSIATRFFRQKIFPGAEQLYVPFYHTLLIVGEDFAVKERIDLAELGFPGFSVLNLLETDHGLLAGVAHWTFRKEGSLIASPGASALLLLDEDGKLLRVLSHTGRSPAENDLDRVEPHDFHHMVGLPSGGVLIQPSKWRKEMYRLDPDLSRIEKMENTSSPAERLAHVLGYPGGTSEGGNLYERFYEVYDGNFTLPFIPDAYRTEPRIVRIGRRLYGVARHGGSDDRVYAFPDSGSHQDARVVEVDVSSQTRSLKRWGSHLVIDDPNRVRVLDTRGLRIGTEESEWFARRPDPNELAAWRAGYAAEYRDVPLLVTDPPDEPAMDVLVQVPGGTFTRFSDDTGDEAGTFEVKPFRMGQTEVSMGEWARVLRWGLRNGYRFRNHGLSRDPSLPVIGIYWLDAYLYCNARSEMEGLKPAYYLDDTRKQVLRVYTDAVVRGSPRAFKWTTDMIDLDAGYRLPTEEEWEFAARGGDPEHRFRYPWGDRISHRLANYRATAFYAFDDSDGGISIDIAQTHFTPLSPVGSFPGHGLDNKFQDLIGNAAEIVMIGFRNAPVELSAAQAEIRSVNKGGSWASDASECTIDSHKQGYSYGQGFRVLLPSSTESQIE
ncbi:MAG: SUMF1/EgtB/PvdO family nonheme iron enzyme [Kiritimatiellia bacterium]